jgi:hypothetical protein
MEPRWGVVILMFVWRFYWALVWYGVSNLDEGRKVVRCAWYICVWVYCVVLRGGRMKEGSIALHLI